MKYNRSDGLLFPDKQKDSHQTGHIVRVAIETSAVDSVYDYLVPEELWPIRKGQVLKVSFGRGNKTSRAFCIEADVVKSENVKRLKSIQAVIEPQPLLGDDLIALAKWISSYYICPLGQVISAMVPSSVKKGSGIVSQRYIYLAGTVDVLPRSAKQKKILQILQEAKSFDSENAIEKTALLESAQCKAGVLKSLCDKGFIKIEVKKVFKVSANNIEGLKCSDNKTITLNKAQQQAIDYITSEIDSNSFSVSVLHGVTDSGKTEVYIRAIEHCLKNNKSAIVLLPEIALTSQMTGRFKQRFKDLAVMHSGLSPAQRNIQWQKIKSSQAKVVLGARSGVFAPVENLGLVIVDEEHEQSYKQDTAPRYHGRDVAIKRAHINNAHCLLGSATPSLESLYNCEHRKHYKLLTMPDRVNDFAPPAMKLVDLKTDRNFNNSAVPSLISEPLEQELEKILSRKEQAILLLNRRGYSNYVYCPSCKHTLSCRNCDVSLTFHKAGRNSALRLSSNMFKTALGEHNTDGYAICHYCLSRTLVPKQCPFCHNNMTMVGFGSQKLEEELLRKFPKASIARIDSDSMQAKDYHKVLEDFGSGSIDILAGTQMLAKGLHFPNVTLVGIISADTSLTLPDFRANERTFQLISQVAGRAGRSCKGGKVIVQSFLTDQPIIKFAIANDFAGFLQEELKHRKLCNLPPYGRLAIIHLRDEKFDRLEMESKKISAKLDAAISRLGLDISVQGPMPSIIARTHSFYRNRIIVSSNSSSAIQTLFSYLRAAGLLNCRCRLAVDIDPVNLL